MKKVYKHPHYRYPSLYDDIAMIELGRRIEYNFDKVWILRIKLIKKDLMYILITILQFGDTPTCIDQGEEDFYGRVAKVQGYGVTEDKTSGTLLETNVTIISNEQCTTAYGDQINR